MMQKKDDRQKKHRSRKGTWGQALLSFFFPICLIVFLRWGFFEPFVIPSGSMIPTLLIHDHILVNKLAYAWHWPFSNRWMLKWGEPQRGDIIVFKYPEQPDVYYVKRLIGLENDRISIKKGELFVNGAKQSLIRDLKFKEAENKTSENDEDEVFEHYIENQYSIQYFNKNNSNFKELKVPPGKLFVMGDNRDRSNDSRFWGFVPKENLVGRALLIWLSCSETLDSSPFLCDPKFINWSRIFKNVNTPVMKSNSTRDNDIGSDRNSNRE